MMYDPQISLRVEGSRLSPSQGLTNSINITIHAKCDEILVNPTNGSITLSGKTIRKFPRFVVNFNLHSSNHQDIQELLRTKLNTYSLLYESLASEISMTATNLGFGFNGFFMNIFVTITYYNHPVVFVQNPRSIIVQRGMINGEELERMKTETESCSILLGSCSKHGEPTRMTCSHVFHGRCLMDWLDRKNTCPMCRIVLYEP